VGGVNTNVSLEERLKDLGVGVSVKIDFLSFLKFVCISPCQISRVEDIVESLQRVQDESAARDAPRDVVKTVTAVNCVINAVLRDALQLRNGNHQIVSRISLLVSNNELSSVSYLLYLQGCQSLLYLL
jgi:hypothetical protein